MVWGLHQDIGLWGSYIPSIYQQPIGVLGKEYLAFRKAKKCIKAADLSFMLAAVRASEAALVVKNLPGHSDVRDAGSILGWGRPIPALLPGEPHGQRSLAGYGP